MMQRTLGLRSAVGLMVGIVIGSGIFASPGFVVADVKSPAAALFVWAMCGMLTLAGALSMAELASAMPRSGGESVYLTRAFHPIVGFWYTWVTSTLAKPAGAAIIALVFSDYVCRLEWECLTNTTEFLPDTGGEVVCEIAPEWVRKGTALGAVWTVFTLQTLSTRAATITQDFFTAEKLCLIAILCVGGVVDASIAAPGSNSTTGNLNPDKSFKGTAEDATDWALAVTSCLFAYNGWNNVFLAVRTATPYLVSMPLRSKHPERPTPCIYKSTLRYLLAFKIGTGRNSQPCRRQHLHTQQHWRPCVDMLACTRHPVR